MIFQKSAPLRGEITVPGDKSISHRAVMLGSVADGLTEIHNFLQGADCLSTINCFHKMGVEVENRGDTVLVHGLGLRGLKKPEGVLDVGNSGTTMRLISGILCGQPYDCALTGDDSIRKRPMGRVIDPLSRMGASVESLSGDGCAPLKIRGKSLHGIRYTTKVASAQVKSAVLLAGLWADGETSVTEPYLSRNHTELMLRSFGGNIRTEGTTSRVRPVASLAGQKISVPGDISSAAYFIAAALIVPGSQVLIRNVGVNPTRSGILKVVKDMGGSVEVIPRRDGGAEPSADILVRHSPLRAVEIGGEIIPTLIDELPVLSVLACFAQGTTVIRDASELKVKESNRIDVMAGNLSSMGASVHATGDGLIVEGGRPLCGCEIDSRADHRIAMSFAVAGLAAEGETHIRGGECVDISYPAFYLDLKSLTGA